MIPNTLQAYDDKMEKILCKYMEHVPEGSRLSGEEMSELILEVSGNALDADFVFHYLDYVEAGKNGKILKWDMNHTYLEETKMKRTNESEQDTLREIEKTYGKATKDALVKYCAMKKQDVEKIVYDTTTDGNGETPWDKFDHWAQTKLNLDIMGGFDDTYDWTGADERAAAEKEREKEEKKAKKLAMKKRNRAEHGLREYDMPEFVEGSGSDPIDEYFISNWIGEELEACEWVKRMDWGDYSDLTVETASGTYRVTVEKE